MDRSTRPLFRAYLLIFVFSVRPVLFTGGGRALVPAFLTAARRRLVALGWHTATICACAHTNPRGLARFLGAHPRPSASARTDVRDYERRDPPHTPHAVRSGRTLAPLAHSHWSTILSSGWVPTLDPPLVLRHRRFSATFLS